MEWGCRLAVYLPDLHLFTYYPILHGRRSAYDMGWAPEPDGLLVELPGDAEPGEEYTDGLPAVGGRECACPGPCCAMLCYAALLCAGRRRGLRVQLCGAEQCLRLLWLAG